jgi:hypothetical protein
MIVPAGVVVVAAIASLALHRLGDRRIAETVGLGVFFTLYDIWYFGGATAILGIFACTIPSSNDGSARLATLPFVPCGRSEGQYVATVIGAVICLALLILGYPVLISATIFRNRNRLDDPGVLLQYGRHYRTFRREFFWWKLVLILRRLAIATVITIVPFYERTT